MKGNKISELAWKDNVGKRYDPPAKEDLWVLILHSDGIAVATDEGIELATIGGSFSPEDFQEIAKEFDGRFYDRTTIELSRTNAYAFMKSANPELELDEGTLIKKGNRVQEMAWRKGLEGQEASRAEYSPKPWTIVNNKFQYKTSLSICNGMGLPIADIKGDFYLEDLKDIAKEFEGYLVDGNDDVVFLSKANAYSFLKAADPNQAKMLNYKFELEESKNSAKGKLKESLDDDADEDFEGESEEEIESDEGDYGAGDEFGPDPQPEDSDEDFDDDEFEDGEDGIDAGEIVVDGKRYCVVLYEIDDEEAEEEAEGETSEEQDEEGEEGEIEEEIAEDEDFHGDNPFAAHDDEMKEEELEEAVKLGLSDAQILKLYK